MTTLPRRIAALEQAVSAADPRQPAILLNMHETEGDALKRCGYPPGTDAIFIKLVPMQPIGGHHAET